MAFKGNKAGPVEAWTHELSEWIRCKPCQKSWSWVEIKTWWLELGQDGEGAPWMVGEATNPPPS